MGKMRAAADGFLPFASSYSCWQCRTLAPGAQFSAGCDFGGVVPLNGAIFIIGDTNVSTTNVTVLYQAVGVVPQQLYTLNFVYQIQNRTAAVPSVQLSVSLTGYANQTYNGFSTTPIAVTSGPVGPLINGTAQVYIPAGINTIFLQIATKPVRPLTAHLPRYVHNLKSPTNRDTIGIVLHNFQC